MNKSGKRRGSEIYFVLYLAALILLLPGKKPDKSSEAIDAITALFQQSFSLLPEKNSLLSRITTDETGASILQLDTSNVLLLTGNIRDVSFECIVEDQQNDKVIQVASKEGEHFSIAYDSTKKLVFFSWHPPISMLASLNKSISYVVTVRAKAKPFISGKNPELQQLLRSTEATLQTEAKFSISILTEGMGETPPKIVYMPAETTFTRMIMQSVPAPAQSVPALPINPVNEANGIGGGLSIGDQEFTLSPVNAKLDVIALQQWSNRVISQGILTSSNYADKPFLTIIHANNDKNGTAEIVDLNNGDIIIQGNAPIISPMKVKVTGKRKTDNKVVTTEFIVNPIKLKEPIFTNPMYPGFSYEFKPEMPASNKMEMRTVLRNSQRELVSSSQGQTFAYTPEIEDTGSVVYFERLINGKPIGKSYAIRVLPFENPEIIKSYENESRTGIFIKVKTFGKFNGKRNRSSIEFDKTKAVNVDLIQQNSADFDQSNPYFVIQTFFVKPRVEGKPISVVIKAKDKFGKISEPVLIQTE